MPPPPPEFPLPPPELRRAAKRKVSTFDIIGAIILVCVPLLALSQFIAHARTDEFDAWLFAVYGRQILRGDVLYLDVWDNKPPGIFWINVLGQWLAGGSLAGVWALCAASVCATVAVFFLAARRLYGNLVAIFAAVLAALFLNIQQFHVGSNRPNTFFVLTEIGCFALYVSALAKEGRRAMWLFFLAGAIGGVGVWFKQSALAMTVAAVIHLVYLGIFRKAPGRVTIARLLVFGAGWCATAALVIVALAATSDLAMAWDAIVAFNGRYFEPGKGASLIPSFAWVEEHLLALGLPLILALASIVYPLLRWMLGSEWDEAIEEERHSPGERPPGLLLLMWTWLAAALYLAAVGPHQRAPYLAVALPPLVALSVHSVHLLLASGRREFGIPRYHVVVGVCWMVFMLIWPVYYQVRTAAIAHYHRFVEPAPAGQVADLGAIQRYTGPDDRIFVFGYGPELYWRSGRAPAIRYIGTEKIGQLGDRGKALYAEVIGLLRVSRPKAILADPVDVRRLDQMLDGPGLSQWLETDYERVAGHTRENLWIARSVD